MAIAADPHHDQLHSTHNALDKLQELVRDDLLSVNRVILDRMQSPVALIPQLAGHLISSGGKRLRPVLTLLCAQMCGYRGDNHIPLAACVEFIHTATLLHDDVVDDSSLRRGIESANAVWGNQASVLVGDFLFSRSFQIMVECGSLQVLEILSNASAVIAEGEVQQLANTNDLSISKSDCLAVITAKTAQLFAAACQIGAVVADQPRPISQALEHFGLNFGIGFQLIDDLIDYSASDKTIGKKVGDDFREGKVTLPVLLTYQKGSKDEQEFWKRTIERGVIQEGDLEFAIKTMKKQNIFAEVKLLAQNYISNACDQLTCFPESKTRKALEDAANFSVARLY